MTIIKTFCWALNGKATEPAVKQERADVMREIFAVTTHAELVKLDLATLETGWSRFATWQRQAPPPDERPAKTQADRAATAKLLASLRERAKVKGVSERLTALVATYADELSDDGDLVLRLPQRQALSEAFSALLSEAQEGEIR